MVSEEKALEIIDVMETLFPDAHCELNFKNEFELVLCCFINLPKQPIKVLIS